jgi:hypothetical protein
VIGKHARDVGAIGIDQLPEQNLGANRHDLDRRHAGAFDTGRPKDYSARAPSWIGSPASGARNERKSSAA